MPKKCKKGKKLEKKFSFRTDERLFNAIYKDATKRGVSGNSRIRVILEEYYAEKGIL